MRYQPYSTPIKVSHSENITPILNFIRYHFRRGKKCVEFGSGEVSTAFLSKIYEVKCFEENRDWLEKFDGVQYTYASIIDGWFEPNTVRRSMPNDYDFVLIDAPCDVNWRANLPVYWKIFKRNKPIVVHAEFDIDILACKRLAEKLKKDCVFFTTEDCHFCVIGMSRFLRVKSHIRNFFHNIFSKEKIRLK